MNDIFTARFIFPETVNIIAPGPNGKDHWERCRDYRIAINRAVLIDSFWPHAWVVADKTAVDKDWWPDAFEYYGLKIFSEKLINEIQMLYPVYPNFNYSFKYERLGKHDTPIPKPEFNPMPGRLQGDGTTTGIAIEMAARLGAKRIILCGVDFEGITHWDGYESPCTITDRTKGWDVFLPFINSLIEWVRWQGIEICSYSKTRLDLEII